MIVFDLECEHCHRFEGWFGSALEFEAQLADKLLTCPVCSSGTIVRRPSAAYVNTGVADTPRREKPGPAPAGMPQQYANVPPEVVARVIEHIVNNTENVGSQFPEEARKIYYKEAPERHIRGVASPDEVESLREEGIEVVSLPLPPHLTNKTH